MNKLLSAEFVRLFKSMIFKISILFSLGCGILIVFVRWIDIKNNKAIYERLGVEYNNADALIFVGALYIIFVLAALIGIFVGTEYSNGTIRNKLTAGHSRLNIYLSKLIVCGACSITIHILYIVTVLIFGNLLIGGTIMNMTELLSFTLTGTFAVIAFTSLLLLFSMSIQSKSVGSVVCLFITIILFFAALTIWYRLDEPKYYDGTTYTDGNTGETITIEKEKNPKYLMGCKRKVYEFLNNFLPVSQLYQIATNLPDNLCLIVIYDCILIIVTTGIGVAVFKKKNIK